MGLGLPTKLDHRIFVRVGILLWILAHWTVPVLLRFSEFIQLSLGHTEMANVKPCITAGVNTPTVLTPLPT